MEPNSTSRIPHICICDDERAIAELVAHLCVGAGYRASVCVSASEALTLFDRDPYDLAILDVMMPGTDGLSCCRALRAKSTLPVIFLTARDTETDKVVGLELGADDYVVKPFKPRELMARVKACLRRSSGALTGNTRPLLEVGNVCIDEDAHEASVLAEPLALTPKEYAILAYLARHPAHPVPTAEIYEQVWGEPCYAQAANTVMVHIRHLRKKIAAIDSSREYIETVWGVGYRLV